MRQSTKWLITICQKCQYHKKQGEVEELLQIGGEEGEITIKCNLGS